MEPSALIIGNTDGVGLCLTRQLLAKGWRVHGVSRRPLALEEPRYRHTVLDVCDPGYGTALRDATAGERIDLCIYCAGVGEFFDPRRISFDITTLSTNLLGLVKTIEVVLPELSSRRGSTLVGLSSLADVMPSGEAPAYAASKAGMSFYLEGIARALKDAPRVVNVRLGFVDTKMAKSQHKPFMITAELAARRILDGALAAKPPSRLDIPRRMAWLMRAVALASRVRAWFPG